MVKSVGMVMDVWWVGREEETTRQTDIVICSLLYHWPIELCLHKGWIKVMGYIFFLLKTRHDATNLYKRPGVAGGVLQTALFLIIY